MRTCAQRLIELSLTSHPLPHLRQHRKALLPPSPHRNRTTKKKNAHRDQKEEMADGMVEEDLEK